MCHVIGTFQFRSDVMVTTGDGRGREQSVDTGRKVSTGGLGSSTHTVRPEYNFQNACGEDGPIQSHREQKLLARP